METKITISIDKRNRGRPYVAGGLAVSMRTQESEGDTASRLSSSPRPLRFRPKRQLSLAGVQNEIGRSR